MNNEYLIRDALYPRVSEALSDPKTVKTLMTGIQKYADSHSDILLSTDFSTRLRVSDSDKDLVFNAVKIKPQEISAVIRQSQYIKANWKVANNPYYIICILVMHFFSVNDKKPELDAITVYMSYLLYTSSHKGSFTYLPNRQVMDYTINNLSNRYLIKQVGSIQGMIEHTVISAMDARYKEDLADASDMNIKDILSALETRVSSVMKNIADEFYKNHKSGNYLFHEDEDLSEENFHLSDNVSFKIDRIVTTVTTSIISDGFDQNTVIKRAISLNPSISEKKLVPMLDTLVEKDMQSISKMVSDIMTVFIYKGVGNRVDDVPTMKFVSECLQIYKSNSQDEIIVRIKERLLSWMMITSEKYGRNFISRGKTSLDNYRRGLYTCFVFKILETVK